MKIKIKETQPLSQGFIAVCESQNPGNPKSRRFKIGEVDFPGNLKSRNLKIRETQNLRNPMGNSKSWKLKNRELKIWEAQNPGNPKFGHPQIQEV